jgi:hypothetical protein
MKSIPLSFFLALLAGPTAALDGASDDTLASARALTDDEAADSAVSGVYILPDRTGATTPYMTPVRELIPLQERLRLTAAAHEDKVSLQELPH